MPRRLTRREFGGALAVAGIAAASTVAQEPPAEEAPGTKKDDRPDKKKDDHPPEADALADFVIARYGKHLDKDQRKVVRSDAADMIKIGAALRAIRLVNADEPDFAFRVVTVPKAAPRARRRTT